MTFFLLFYWDLKHECKTIILSNPVFNLLNVKFGLKFLVLLMLGGMVKKGSYGDSM